MVKENKEADEEDDICVAHVCHVSKYIDILLQDCYSLPVEVCPIALVTSSKKIKTEF